MRRGWVGLVALGLVAVGCDDEGPSDPAIGFDGDVPHRAPTLELAPPVGVQPDATDGGGVVPGDDDPGGPDAGGPTDDPDESDVVDVAGGDVSDEPDAGPVDPADVGGDDPVDAGEPEPDAGGGEPDAGGPDPDVGGPDPDVGGPEPDVPVDPPAPICDSDDAAVARCGAVCSVLEFCGLSPWGNDCYGGCVAAAEADPNYEANLQCIGFAAQSGEEGCPLVPLCLQPAIEEVDDCDALCDVVDSCDSGPDPIFGDDLCSCRAGCGALGLLLGTGQAVIASCTYSQLLQGCNDYAGSLCSYAFQQEGICASACETFDGCTEFPNPFGSTEACLAACAAWSPEELIMGATCLGSAPQPDGGCSDPTSCAVPPPTYAPEALALCESIADICGPTGVQGLPGNPGLCAYVVTGFAHLWPGSALSESAACVAALDTCPDPEDNAIGLCLSAWSPCKGYCESIIACELIDTTEPDIQAVCEVQCGGSHLLQPDVTNAYIECVGAADSCDAIPACFGG